MGTLEYMMASWIVEEQIVLMSPLSLEGLLSFPDLLINFLACHRIPPPLANAIVANNFALLLLGEF